MITRLNRFPRIVIGIFVFAMTMLSGTGHAEDTDIYLEPRAIPRDDAPNVLVIFDNSGSMDTNVTIPPSYDATVTYAGTAGNVFDDTRVYWSTSGSEPTSPNDNWFASSDNQCGASQFNLGSSAGATGKYLGDNIVGWIHNYTSSTNTTKGRWNNLSGGDNADSVKKMKDVECSQDDPAQTGSNYLTDSNNSNLAYASRYTNTVGDALDFSGYSSPALFSGNYLNYFDNPPAATTRERIEIAREVIKDMINSTVNVKFGLMVFNSNNPDSSSNNNGGRIILKIDTMTAARKTTYNATVDGIDPDTWTPLSETLYEAYLYFAGKSVDFGNDSNGSDGPAKDITAEDGSGNYDSPFSKSCQKGYVILITDGEPTRDDDADSKIEALTGGGPYTASSTTRLPDLANYLANTDLSSISGVQSLQIYTIGFITNQTLLSDTATQGNGSYYYAVDAAELSTSLQNILVDIVNTSSSFNAPTLSVNAFNTLYNRDEVYFSMFLPESTVAWPGNLKKYTLCKGTEVDSGGNPKCYVGEVIDVNQDRAIDQVTLNIKGEEGQSSAAKSYWSSARDGKTVKAGGAGEKIPTFVSPPYRNIYTFTGTYLADKRTPDGAPIDLVTSGNHDVDIGNANLTNAMFGVASTTEREFIIRWMLGDADGDDSTTLDRWAYHDPLHAKPVTITYGSVCISSDVIADGCTLDGANPAKPNIRLVSATNDGGIRFINEETGVEEWVFVPQEMLKDVNDGTTTQENMRLDANGNHIYGIDATPTFLIYDNNGNGVIETGTEADKVYMFIGMRRGGSNIYALDLTPDSTMTSSGGTVKPKLMWVIKGGTNSDSTIQSTDYENLGQTWSRPLVADINMVSGGGSAKTTVLIMGGGYDPNQDGKSLSTDSIGNGIYIIDPITGDRLLWISSSVTGNNLAISGMDYSIPSDIALIDTDGDRAIDRLYVGDVGGQVIRVDLAADLNNDNKGSSSGYIFADLSCPTGTRTACTGTALQDMRKFIYRPNVSKVTDSTYSTEAKYDIITIASGDRADPLDDQTVGLATPVEEIHNRIYALRDYNIGYGGPGSTPSPIDTGDLYDATGNLLLDDSDSNCGSADKTALMGSVGWYIDLIDQKGTSTSSDDEWVGEKALSRTVILDGYLFVTTYTPPSTTTAQLTCQASEGAGTLYAIPLLSGGYCSIVTTVNVGGGIPPELSVITREEGVTGLVGTFECLDLPLCCTRGDTRTECCDRSDPDNDCTNEPDRDKTFWWEE